MLRLLLCLALLSAFAFADEPVATPETGKVDELAIPTGTPMMFDTDSAEIKKPGEGAKKKAKHHRNKKKKKKKKSRTEE